MASAMSVTWISSKHSSRASSATSFAASRDELILPRAPRARFAQEGVPRQHEFVEVDAALLLHRRRFEEEIEQHRLAAPDRSPEVKPARRLASCAASRPAASASSSAASASSRSAAARLVGVGREIAFGEALAVRGQGRSHCISG